MYSAFFSTSTSSVPVGREIVSATSPLCSSNSRVVILTESLSISWSSTVCASIADSNLILPPEISYFKSLLLYFTATPAASLYIRLSASFTVSPSMSLQRPVMYGDFAIFLVQMMMSSSVSLILPILVVDVNDVLGFFPAFAPSLNSFPASVISSAVPACGFNSSV